VLAVPSITAAVVIGKCCLQTLQRHIRTAHNGLSHIIEAVDHVPVVVLLELVTRCHAAVDRSDGIQAVQLVRHAGGENSSVGPDDRSGEVVVVFGVRNALEAHANCYAGSVRVQSCKEVNVLGRSSFQARRVSGLKNSEVLYGAKVWLILNVVICVGTVASQFMLQSSCS
jgi:hypothetical protein